MKASTLHSLITARTLHDEAVRLVASGDRHMCSAGLLMLQDGLEIVLLALLTELGVDEKTTLESKGFDELIGEMKKYKLKVPKSGTLKALNKQRVITKHYGQLAEPVTVQGYVEAAELALDSILPQVLGKKLNEIFLTELLNEGEAQDCLTQAARLIDEEKLLDALIEVRKALFIEIEYEYAIHEWSDAESGTVYGLLEFSRGGLKAPYWTRNKEWIEKNVDEPLDYVQIDHERLRLDGIEWGVNTADLENLRRLTPNVFRRKKGSEWHVQYDLSFPPNNANASNARYCLDRAISVLLRKQYHQNARRWPEREVAFDPPTIYLDAAVFDKASRESNVVHRINSEYEYTTRSVVTGFDPSERYYIISGHRPDPESMYGRDWVSGFLLIQEEGNG